MTHRYKHIALTALIATIMLWALPSRAQEEEAIELSLSTMVMFALEQSPELKMAREREIQMGYYADEARSDYMPQIQLNVEGGQEYLNPTGGRSSNSLGKSSVVLNQKIFDGYATRAEVNRRGEVKNAAEYDASKRKEDLVLKVTEYYLDVLRYQGVVKTTDTFVSEVDEIVVTIGQMFDAGAASKVMLDYARSRQASAYVDLNEAKSSLNDAQSNLEFLTGELPPFIAVTPDELRADNLNKEVYIDLASEENSLIKKNKAEIDAMQYQLRAEKAQYYPKVDFKLKAEQTHNDGGEVGRGRNMKATVNLTYDIFDGFNKDKRVNRVTSQVKELELKDQKIFDELKKEINLAYNQIFSIQAALKSTNSEIASNKALQGLNRENFKLGAINVIELIEGEERLQDSFSRKYKLQNTLLRNTYSLLITSAILEERFFCETCADENVENDG